jgi:hypothetical protein
MVRVGPSRDSGWAITLTRLPSGRRASQIGEASSTRRPTWLTIRWQMFISWALSRKADVGELGLAAHFDEHPVGAVAHDVGDLVARQQRLERAVAKHVVDDVLHQVIGLGDRHRDVLDRHQFGDDVADLLGRRRLVQLRQLARSMVFRRALKIVVLVW